MVPCGRGADEAFTGVCSRYLTTLEIPLNAFYEHHKDSIEFHYRCFDRLLLNGLILPFQQPERVLGFFNTYREGKRVTRQTLTEIADQFQYWEEPIRKSGVFRFWRLPTATMTRAGETDFWTSIFAMPSRTRWWRSLRQGNRLAS